MKHHGFGLGPLVLVLFVLKFAFFLTFLLTISFSMEVHCSRPIRVHHLHLTSNNSLMVAQAYSGPSKRGKGHK